jgi:Ribonuclease G/E
MGVKRNPMHAISTRVEAAKWGIEQGRYHGNGGLIKFAKLELAKAQNAKRKLRKAIKAKRKQKHANR